MVCKGEQGEEAVVNHYAVVDASKDEIVEGEPEKDCKQRKWSQELKSSC